MNPANIKPALSAEPLRTRRQGEPWLDWARELYAHTLAELEMSPEAWAAHFGSAHPGAGYTKVMEAQKRRLARDIEAEVGKAQRAFRSEKRRDVLHGVFVTALEGGINYWCSIKSYHWAKSGAGEEYTGDLDNFRAVVIDDEDDGKEHVIDIEVIARGINRLADATATFGGQPLNGDGHLHKLALALNGPKAEDVDYDAGDADNIVQAGLFNDIVYG
jgi:hypothetical protein